MSTIELLIKIKEDLNKPFNTNDIGILIEKNGNDIHILEAKNEVFDKVIIFYEKNRIKKVNFVSKKPIFSLKDLTEAFGDYEVGYSFRDNLTKLLFSNGDGIIKEVTTKIDDELEIKEEIIKKTPRGEKKNFNKNELLFNSVCFNF